MINNEKHKMFVTERYKGKKKNKRFKKIIQSILFGGLAGFIATMVFIIFAPVFMKYFYLDKEEPIKIQTEKNLSENHSLDDGNKETIKDKEKKEGSNKEEKQKNSEKEKESKQPVIVEKVVPFDIKDYKKLYSDFDRIVENVKKSVIQVVIEKSDEEGLIPAVEKYRNIGLIVAENKKSFFILTTYFKESKKSAMKAIIGESVNPLNIAGYNENLGLMIVKLNKSELSKELYDSLEVAQLAVSNYDSLGKPILVYGTICDGRLGYANGSICSYENTNRFIDATYPMLMSTVFMDEQATGIIIDLEGKVSGFIDKNSKTKYKEAFSVAELNSVIEKLSNGEKIPVLGIKAEIVADKNISKEIKDGVFVFEVMENTPAMNHGILPGDIITKIDYVSISNMQQVQNTLKNCKSKQNIKIELMRQKFDKYDKIEIELELK